MKLTIVRHGETIENKAGIRQGHLPGRLSEEGIEQARKVAIRLKDEKIDIVYSSDLSRAIDTAKEILKYHDKVPVFYVQELREFNNGILQGRKRSETKDIDWENPPEGVEKKSEGLERAKKFIGKILSRHKGKHVLFVTHGFFTKALITAIRDKDVGHFEEIDSLGNTSVSVFEFMGKEGNKTILFNDTKHL